MKQDILYLNLPDSYCQIFLPTENNRKYELELSASLDALEAQLGSRLSARTAAIWSTSAIFCPMTQAR